MIYYLIFCTMSMSAGDQVCIAPTPTPSQRACRFMLREYLALAGTTMGGEARAKGRCLGVVK
jgi:uncharacterized protein (DUF1786 family)